MSYKNLVGKKFKASGCSTVQDIITVNASDSGDVDNKSFTGTGVEKFTAVLEFTKKLSCTSWEVNYNGFQGIAKENCDGSLSILVSVYMNIISQVLIDGFTNYIDATGRLYLDMNGKLKGKNLYLNYNGKLDADVSESVKKFYENLDWHRSYLASAVFKPVC
jgi:hypothetical protein